ncbi:hypothetical protein [Synechococcus sp. CC9616]|uniref:hypothetical protein n=1 Tax=Synechococcus sp. CC9616 TaxID=110663 RepID=UPI0004B5F366|nr:hypothetical protein [Synechococcus sp. CC9616]RPF84020.1 MAG: hypothetical protein CBB80_002925 [Synechococcus sp. TMED20]
MRPSIASTFRIGLSALVVSCLSSCAQTATQPAPDGSSSSLAAAMERLQMRVDELEKDLKEKLPDPVESNEKTPAGPIDSLTLQLGTNDDRLRLYWKDGQTSNLECSQEGEGRWACG